MAEYRSSSPKSPNHFGALGSFLNIKKAFDDAVKKERWERERQAQIDSQVNYRQRVSTAGSLATYGGASGAELNQFINEGTFPDNLSGGAGGPGVYMIDPITGELKQSGNVGRGSRVFKGVLSPEQMRERGIATGEADFVKENMKQSGKLGTAVKRLALLNKQFNEALPSGDRTPLEQRIVGGASSWAAKKGLVNNPKLVALRKNIRPMAINLIRAFGEVGNLSETEQQGAIDVVSQAELTDEERIAQTKQFIEFALAGAGQDGIRMLQRQRDIRGILDAFGVDVDSLLTEQPMDSSASSDDDIRSKYNALRESGVSAAEAKKRLGI